jgi:uncharacterized protein YacL (UPF0231 family)
MAKSKNTSVSNSEPLLFSTEQYSSEIGNLERLHQYDPYWNEIVLDSSEFLEENKQGISLSQLSQLPTEELVKETENSFTVGQRIFSQKENRKGAIAKIGKSGFTVDWDGWVTVPYSFTQIKELQLSKIEELDSCLPCSTPTPAQEQLPLQVTSLELKQPSLSKLTPTPNESLNTDSQISPFTTTSEPIKDNLNGITFAGYHSLVPEQVTPESVQDLTIQNQECGSIPCERSPLNSLNLLLLNNPEELLTTDLEQCLEDCEWSNIVGKIQKSYQQRNSAHPTKEKGCSLLPTPTTYPKGSTGCRPAGTNRLEQKLRPFIHKGDKLHPSVAGWMMGFPIGWVEYPLADTGEMLSVQLPFIPLQDTISKTDGTALTSTDEQLHLNKQKLPSKESVISQNSLELLNQESELLTPTTPTTPTTSKIKAITLHQPWASLVGRYKHYETRGKATNYRGKITIHAAIRQETTDYQVNQLSDLLVGEEIPFGSVVAIAQLTDCIKMTEEFISQQTETELRCGLWEVGRYAWKLENVEILDEPIPARGMPGLWEIEIPCSLFPVPSSELPITRPEFKTGEYILNGRVGEIIEASPGEYFSVKYGNSHTDLKCYFWGQDDELIDQLAIPTERFAIAPQDLVEKFVRENQLSTDIEISPTNDGTERFVRENNLSPDIEISLTNDGTERFVRENNLSPDIEISLTNDGTEQFVRENNLSTDVEVSLTNDETEKFVRENNLSTDVEVSLTNDGTEKFVRENNLSTGAEVSLTNDGTEQFVRENNLSTGAEVSLTNDGTEKFVRENNLSTGAEVSLTNDGTEQFVRENNLSTGAEVSLTNDGTEKFVRENNLSTDVEISLTKKKKIASGSLAPFVENKKLKDGTIATYPKVSGERDPLNHLHWRWGYYYEIKIDGEWKNRSLPVAARIVPQVKIMIENHCPVEEIKNAILQSKHQKRGNNS